MAVSTASAGVPACIESDTCLSDATSLSHSSRASLATLARTSSASRTSRIFLWDSRARARAAAWIFCAPFSPTFGRRLDRIRHLPKRNHDLVPFLPRVLGDLGADLLGIEDIQDIPLGFAGAGEGRRVDPRGISWMSS